MSFDTDPFLPSLNEWFVSSPEYDGWGRAKFVDPPGSIEGRTVVRFDELGHCTIEMEPDLKTLRCERELRFGLDEFLSGSQPVKTGDTYMLSWTFSSQNPCNLIEVVTWQGSFVSTHIYNHGRRDVFGPGPDEFGVGIRFDVFDSHFWSSEAQEPAFWVLPLTNFLADFGRASSDFDRHPLRLFPTPEVPDEITHVRFGPDHEKDKSRAICTLHAANSRNYLIEFQSDGSSGFIECLPDYHDRRENLLSGKARTLTTTLAVGTIRRDREIFSEPENFLQADSLLTLLTLATGSEVGAPWIEVRDGRGDLVLRHHRRLREPLFSRGYCLVKELPFNHVEERREEGKNCQTGVGYLVSKALTSEESRHSAFKTAVFHLVRSKYRAQSLDESMAHLCRGLDGLCEYYGLARQNLMQSLDEDQKKAVREVLAEAYRKVRAIKDIADVSGGPSAVPALGTIEQRIQNAANMERKFGLAVADLLQRFALPDAEVIDGHYRDQPRSDGLEHWVDVVSHYRTDVIHRGYLDLEAGGHDWRDIWAIINHLHDVMARVVLQALKYDGRYQPTVIPQTSIPFDVDWVKPDTMPGTLGF